MSDLSNDEIGLLLRRARHVSGLLDQAMDEIMAIRELLSNILVERIQREAEEAHTQKPS